ncbi:hypothetical protein A5780_18475 [Nocardia sp. 852002-20019_SCH5090214]|nr:hypothetical protein A5780_18475 [Nocardia sp. 852002-20019_SCH5090214]
MYSRIGEALVDVAHDEFYVPRRDGRVARDHSLDDLFDLNQFLIAGHRSIVCPAAMVVKARIGREIRRRLALS